jgi:hypothetical protein
MRRDEMPHRDVVDAFLDECHANDALPLVHEVLAVHGDRWWTYSCDAIGCLCPIDGRPVDASGSTFAAAATYRGMVALPTRADAVALLDPVPDRDLLLPLIVKHENAMVQAAVQGHGQRSERAVKRAIFAGARDLDAGAAMPTDERAARFGVALTAITIRDAVWLAIDEHRIDGTALWRDLARRLPPPYDAAPLFLAGWSAWRAGNGMLAGEAARRAIASDRAYSAADLLLAAVDGGIDPRRMPRLRPSQRGRRGTTGARRAG